MRVVFMGTPDFAVPALRALASRHTVAKVYCQPPRPAGRGQALRPSAVQRAAESLDLDAHYPVSLRGAEEVEALAALKPDVAVVAAYGLILPQAILDIPVLGCINIHGSLLPRWRGAAPVHRAIMAGDTETGITIMQMEAGLDTGPMLLRKAVPITDTTTTGLLHDTLAETGATLILEALDGLEQGTLKAVPQPEKGITYAEKINKAEARIDWDNHSSKVARHINGLSPFPGAWFEHAGTRIKVLAAEPVEGQGQPGAILDNGFTVACSHGAVRLLSLQRAGRDPMDAEAFYRGFPISPGTLINGQPAP
ncbi:methionyl-tRNA formyltransferase [Haematospirillum sp. H1815]|uniref:methionyl-tRNA formyltransferase n=1 Tax=Haematospirillum sp. H1815 TaxID=2723108 RepID=UPI001438D7D4|nr:methionyl-tRNA formyltransferase [Haematospirillum sp. H1815]NKD76956.1 methionyl-tRNA formyltransferase [Haematospirillum sp. H1815]